MEFDCIGFLIIAFLSTLIKLFQYLFVIKRKAKVNPGAFVQ